MSRERLVSPDIISKEEEGFNRTLRPPTLAEYIGQKKVVEKLEIALEAARRRSEPLEHALFHGPPGLGKTTLAHIIASAMGSKITTTSGPALERTGDLMGILTNLGEGDILFIDEIHRLPANIEEFLYPAMEDFRVDFVVDKGMFAKTINVPLKKFTLIGATTRAGSLSAPLRNRLGLVYHLDFYDLDELQKIVVRSARILDARIDDGGSSEIARRARGTPRIANRLLRRVRDFAEVRADGVVDRAVARAALQVYEVDEIGLDRLDRAVLDALLRRFGGGPVGLSTIAVAVAEEPETVETVAEPFLVRCGLLARTPRGRVATASAWRHLGLTPPAHLLRPPMPGIADAPLFDANEV